MKAINFRDIANKFLKNLSWLFFAAFVVLVVFEIFEINTSVNLILGVNQQPPAPVTQKGVRINFDNYNYVINRIQGAAAFQPSGGITKDPFNPGVLIAPADSSAQSATTTPTGSGGG